MVNITPASWVFLFLTCVFLPLMAVRSAFRIRQPGRTPSRSQYLVSVFFSQGMMLLPALYAADCDSILLFPEPRLGAIDVVAALAFLVPTLGTLPLRWRRKSEEEKRRMLWMLPHGTADLGWWALVSLTAGIVEELVYRGVMLALWQRVFGSWWAAVIVCVTVFSLAHFVQGWRSMALIVIIATAFHLIVRFTGDLYTAMAVHCVYDFAAGILLQRYARRDGLLPVQASG